MYNRSVVKSFYLFRSIALAAISLVLLTAPNAFGQLGTAQISELQERAIQEDWTFTVGENSATEYPLEQLCGLTVPDNWQEGATFNSFSAKRALPSSFDWRDLDGVTPIRNQAGCGSCWAFGTVGALECNIKIKDGVSVDLSEQYLVSCNSNGWGCDGGWWAHDYHQWRTDPCDSVGAVFETDFPYAASDLPCSCPYEHHYLIEDWAYVGNSYGVPGVDAMKQAIMDYGPIAVGVSANSAMQAYTGGIFNGCENGDLNHGVVLVGWDDNQGTAGVWFMRNSWGPGWGEDGYMRMEYGCSYIGYGASYVVYNGTTNLSFDYPDGPPQTLTPDQPTSFEVVVTATGSAVVQPGSGQLHYRINSGVLQTIAMTETTANHYTATLPVSNCGDHTEYFVSAVETTLGRLYDPDPTHPNLAVAVANSSYALMDNFETDIGWSVTGDATAGQWQRGIPADGDRGDPPADFDGSGRCYLTGNVAGDSDVDNGTTYLRSPVFDLSGTDGLIHYARWYSNDYGSNPSSDVMRVFITNDNGAVWVPVDSAGPSDQASGGWYEISFWVSRYVTPTASMRLRFEVSDLGDGSVVEAALDDVTVLTYNCVIYDPIEITTADMPEWTAGHPYSQTLEAVGGTGNYTWSDKNGNLDETGLAVYAGGVLAGVASVGGPITFTLLVTDDESNSDEKIFTIQMNPALYISTPANFDWTVDRPFAGTLSASGGTGAVVWQDINNDLTGTGLSLSTEGAITGTPTAAGPVSFTAEITDDIGAAYQRLVEFTINPALTLGTSPLPEATEDEDYSHQLEYNGGTGNITWENTGGELAGTGLSLAADGLLSGTPETSGDITFTVHISDIAGSETASPLQLTIIRPFICGDVNDDGRINLADISRMIAYVYLGAAPFPHMGAANVNGDEEDRINLADISLLISHVYLTHDPLRCP